MGDRSRHLPVTSTRTLPLADIGPHRHDPIKPPVRIEHQHVPYGPGNVRKRVFPGLHQGEVSLPDPALTELMIELASLESVSCEEERAGCVLIYNSDRYEWGSFVGREGYMRNPRWKEEDLDVRTLSSRWTGHGSSGSSNRCFTSILATKA